MAGNRPQVRLALVTGVTGALGPRIVEALLRAGHAVRTLSLDSPGPGHLSASTETRLGDITDKPAVRSAMAGVEVVIHLAALLHIVNPSPELRSQYERVNIGGTGTVVESALSAGAKRVVLFSTIAVYGQANGQILNESSPTQPETYYARTKLDGPVKSQISDGFVKSSRYKARKSQGAKRTYSYAGATRDAAQSRFIGIDGLLTKPSNLMRKRSF